MKIENQILRYLSGEASEQEIQQMQVWLQESEENRQLFALHKKTWLSARVLAEYDANQIKQSREKVDLKISNSELQRSLKRANRRIRMMAYAASVALLLGITSVLYLSQKETPVKQSTVLTGGEVEVPYGSKSLMTLPDGSKVWMNAGSKISYPADFGLTSRNVFLAGEAYFDVAKMEEIPFYVNTDVLKIKVYGTAFNVKAYTDDDRVETTLDRGAISIIRNDAPDREISVKLNQKITILRDNQKSPVSSTLATTATVSSKPTENLKIQEMKSTEAITAWKDNKLIFEKEPLWSLAKQLERTYNVSIKFNSEKIKSFRYSAAIKEMPIDQVLEAIAMSSPISYHIKGSEITLSENKQYILKKRSLNTLNLNAYGDRYKKWITCISCGAQY